jgi:hypothetical protein
MASTTPEARNANRVNRRLKMSLSIHVLLSHKSTLSFQRSVYDLYLRTIVIGRQNLNRSLIIYLFRREAFLHAPHHSSNTPLLRSM